MKHPKHAKSKHLKTKTNNNSGANPKSGFLIKSNGKLRVGRLIFAVILPVLLVSVGILVYFLLSSPQLFFKTSSVKDSSASEAVVTASSQKAVESIIDIPSVSVSEGSQNNAAGTQPDAAAESMPPQSDGGSSSRSGGDDESSSNASDGSGDKIVNILLMGIDAYENGGTTSGTEPHTDVVILCAINFDKNTVDLISIPRDTFTRVSGYYGFYRLNSVFNVGGGLKDPDAGFSLVCRLIEDWMGGISIPYYYAVDFQAVIDIVDAIGGVDYNVDVSATGISKGQQHLDGEGVLTYLRVRDHNNTGDRYRNERQRRMLIAIFNQLRSAQTLTKLPELINAAGSGIYTNTTLAQTAALAGYAARLDSLTINSRSMDGERGAYYDWLFSFVYQQDRIDMIREVYGIEAEPVRYCSRIYEEWLHLAGLKGLKYLKQGEKVFTYINSSYTGENMTDEQRSAYVSAYLAYQAAIDAYNAADNWYLERYDSSITITDEELAERDALIETLEAAGAQLKSELADLVKLFKYTGSVSYYVKTYWNTDPDINEVIVDFN